MPLDPNLSLDALVSLEKKRKATAAKKKKAKEGQKIVAKGPVKKVQVPGTGKKEPSRLQKAAATVQTKQGQKAEQQKKTAKTITEKQKTTQLAKRREEREDKVNARRGIVDTPKKGSAPSNGTSPVAKKKKAKSVGDGTVQQQVKKQVSAQKKEAARKAPAQKAKAAREVVVNAKRGIANDSTPKKGGNAAAKPKVRRTGGKPQKKSE